MAQVLPMKTHAISNKPKNIKIGPEMKKIWSKQCLSHISFIFGPILMFLGLFEMAQVFTGNIHAIA
jgi:hypothetical protein